MSNRRNRLLMRYWNTYNAKSEMITSNQSTSQRRTHGPAADSSSLHFRYICTIKQDQEIIPIQTERYNGRYFLLKCMIFHTFISYLLIDNLNHYLLLKTCRSCSHSRSLILQSDIVEARAHYPVLTTMLHLIDHHLTQQSEVERRSNGSCLKSSQLKNIFYYSKLYFFSIMLIRASTGGTRPPTQLILLRCLICLFREYFSHVLKIRISKQIYFADYSRRIVKTRVAKGVVFGYINTTNLKCPLAVAEVWLMSADLDRLLSIQIVAVNMFEEMCNSAVAIFCLISSLEC